MRILILIAAVCSALAGPFTLPTPAQAARGIPGSAEFGYGARLQLDGLYLDEALELAADTRFDWLAVTVRWNALQSDPAYAARLDKLMTFAGRNELAVLVSLTQPPAAAFGVAGPDPAQTAAQVAALAQRFAGPLQAVELFPGANTRSGWGAPANPEAYASLYNQVQTQLQSAGLPLLLVGGGLQPLSTPAANGDLPDLVFLQRVYQAGAFPTVISVQLTGVADDPLAAPGIGQPVLRHYEEVRQVMSLAGQDKSVIWITAFRAASGTIQTSGVNSANGQVQQNASLYQVMAQLRSQLYIGVAFYDSLNPLSMDAAQSALIPSDMQYHPYAGVFRELIGQNGGSTFVSRYGRSKGEGINKPRP